jgi:hypothetical protein
LETISIADAERYFDALSDKARAKIVAAHRKDKTRWRPNPGPQQAAYNSAADILFFGGAAGGGKTEIGLGLAFMEHKRSLIMRRMYANLSALTERAIEINGTRDGFNGSPPPLLRTADGRYIQFAGCQHAGDETAWQGHPFDYKFFDEACLFLESQVRFHLGWLRSADPNQRCRAILASNPPMTAQGDWIVGMFRPWLDLTHPKPAKPGELRWFVTAPDDSDLEVDGPTPVQIQGRKLIPMSRTFIPAKLADNPYLVRTDYQAKLDGLPEPYRSAARDGNFMAARADDEFQCIKVQWIIEAQNRWKRDGYKDFAQTAMGFDPAGGGKDAAALAYRHGGWYGEIISKQGAETADPADAAATIFRWRKDGAPIVIDVGGGFASGVILAMQQNGLSHQPFNGANSSTAKTIDGQLHFANKRAEAWWRFREALDPDQEGGSAIALPPDPELRADLAAPRYKISARGILIESKDDLRKRLGRSPNKGDAVIMALSEGDVAVRRALNRSAGSNLPKFAKTSSGPLGRYRRRG